MESQLLFVMGTFVTFTCLLLNEYLSQVDVTLLFFGFLKFWALGIKILKLVKQQYNKFENTHVLLALQLQFHK